MTEGVCHVTCVESLPISASLVMSSGQVKTGASTSGCEEQLEQYDKMMQLNLIKCISQFTIFNSFQSSHRAVADAPSNIGLTAETVIMPSKENKTKQNLANSPYTSDII